MKFVLLIVGGIAALFLIPVFNSVWDNLTPSLIADFGVTNSTTNGSFVLLWFKLIPYIIPIVCIIAAFITLRRREGD